jgi:hypothetical protein
MPDGKPAGVRCIQLDADNFCLIFGQPQRPAVCSAFHAAEYVCGSSAAEAIQLIGWLEQSTAVAL